MKRLRINRVNVVRFFPEYLIGVVFLFSGCVAKPPSKGKGSLELKLPSSYQSKLDIINSDTNSIKQISKDGK